MSVTPQARLDRADLGVCCAFCCRDFIITGNEAALQKKPADGGGAADAGGGPPSGADANAS
jgi:hypothetical protein